MNSFSVVNFARANKYVHEVEQQQQQDGLIFIIFITCLYNRYALSNDFGKVCIFSSRQKVSQGGDKKSQLFKMGSISSSEF